MKKDYFLKRDGSYYLKETRQEILEKIDYDKPETFLPYLKDMDYPYIEYEWNVHTKYWRDNKKNNIFGRYLSLMRLWSFRSFTWKDSDRLNERVKRIYDIDQEKM